MSIEAIIANGRRLVESTLLDSCTVQRRSLAIDAGGGRTETWTALLTGIPCRFGTVNQEDPQQLVDAVYGAPTAQALIPLGTDVRRGDRLLNESSGNRWLVVGIKTPDSEVSVISRLLIREVDT